MAATDIKGRVLAQLRPTGDRGGGPDGRPTTRPPQGRPSPQRSRRARTHGPAQPVRLWDIIEPLLAKLPAEQQAAVRARVTPLIAQAQQHFDGAGSHLPFHPSLEHAHGPDGAMIQPVGRGGLGMPPAPPVRPPGFPHEPAGTRPAPVQQMAATQAATRKPPSYGG